MTRARISRGTPYIQTTADIENTLAAATPQMEENIAAMLRMPAEEWRAQPVAVKVKQINEHQIRGQAAAALAAATKAQTDFTEAVQPITEASQAAMLRDEVDALRDMVADLLKSTSTRKGK
jgi:hypothetical protein